MRSFQTFRRFGFPFLLIALAASSLIAFLVVSRILPYRIRVLQTEIYSGPAPLIHYDFHDDGITESLKIAKNLDSSYTSLLLYQQDQTFVETFNFRGLVSFSRFAGGKWIHIADYDGNQVDDLFVFHQWQDTLFLALVDMAQLETVWDIPVVIGNLSAEGQWDVALNDVQLVELDDPGKPYLLFALYTGYALRPRGIYAFDLQRKTVAYRYSTRMDITGFHVCDVNGDGRKELVLSTYASDNYPEDAPEPNDLSSWFVILNSHLEPLFEPVRVGPRYSGLEVSCLHHPANPSRVKLLSLLIYDGKENVASRLIEWNSDGQRVREKALYRRKRTWSIYFDAFPDRLYLFSTLDKPEISIVDSSLTVSNRISIQAHTLALLPYQVDRNHPLLLLVTTKELVLLDKDLQVLGRFYHADQMPLAAPLVSFIRPREEGQLSQIILAEGKREYTLEVQRNPYYEQKALLFSGLALSGTAVLYVGRALLTMIFLALGYFIATLRNNPRASLILWPNGRIAFRNAQFSRLLNLSGRKIYHLNDFEKSYPELSRTIATAMQNQEYCQNQISLSRDQQQLVLNVKVVPFQILFRPRAYYIEMEENTSAPLSERLQLWTLAVQQLAHDIKSPVSAVKFGLRVLEERIKKMDVPKERKGSLLEAIHDQLHAIEEIGSRTQKFLKVNNIIRPQFYQQNLHTVLEKSIQNFHKFWNDSGVTLSTSFDESIPEFCFDKDQMEILFNTLIENALDAMKGRGQLAITTLLQEDLMDGQLYVEITIADNGSGIPEEIREILFKKRVTTKTDKGSGIGLILVKNIVDNHGGTIQFKSSNSGTVFVIKIPVHKNCGG